MKNNLLLALTVGLTVTAQAMTTYHWSDAVDDKWSTAGNWEEGAMPTSTDVEVEVTCTRGSLNLDTADGAAVKIKRIKFMRGAWTYVTGSPLKLLQTANERKDSQEFWVTNGCGKVVVDVPVTFGVNGGYFELNTQGDGIDFLKPVTALKGTRFRITTGGSNSSLIRFFDSFRSQTAVEPPSAAAYVCFYGPTTAPSAHWSAYNGWEIYYGATNDIGTISAGYKMTLQIGCENAFTASTELGQGSLGTSSSTSWHGCVNFNNFNQVFNRITGCYSYLSDMNRVIRSNRDGAVAPTVLTLKGSASANTTYAIGDMISVVWDPTGDFVQCFTNRVNATRGSVTVKGGTFRVAGTGTFANLAAIDIRSGATFDLASTVAGALANVRHLLVAGTLAIGAKAATPFSGGVTVAQIAAGGKISVGAGQTVTLAGVRWNGAYLADDTYSGEDWIDGEGSVTVDSSKVAIWKEAADGAWGTAANWVGGAVPTAAQNAYVDAGSASDYTVSVAAAATLPKRIDVFNPGGGTATLSIGAATTQTDGRLLVGAGGRVLIPTGGSLTADLSNAATAADDDTVAVENGGLIRLTGGTLGYSNFTGAFALGGTETLTSRFEIVSGTFNFTPKAANHSLVVTRRSAVSWSDATVSVPAALNAFKLQDGLFEVKGASVVTKSSGSGVILKRQGGAFALAGTASWPVEFADIAWGDSLGGGAFEATVDGSATWQGINYRKLTIGASPGSSAKVVFDSPAVDLLTSAILASSLHVGCENASADVEFRSGSYYLKDYGLFVGWQLFNSSVLRLTGATLHNKGGSTGYAENQMLGINVGQLFLTKTKTGRYATGRVEMSAGCVTNTDNHLTVGTGFATGTWSQTGGDVQNQKNFIVGAAHGAGTFDLAGGTVTCRDDLFVGGIETNLLASGTFGDRLVSSGWPIALHDAEGVLRVRGGTFTGHAWGQKRLTTYVGLDGCGTIEMDGTAGRLLLGHLVLTNNPAATATSGATLSFKLGADGVTPIRCYGNVTIGAGTKLKVDFTDYAGTERRIPLVVIDDGTKWSFSGSVASSDIEVTGVPEGRAFVLDQKGAQLIARLRGTGGMAVLLK